MRSLPDSNNPLNLQLSNKQLVRYEDGIGGTNVTFEAMKRSFVLPPLVQTGCVLQNMDLFKTWLADEQPIIVSGPEDCGKNLMIRHSISRLHDEFDLTFNVAVRHYARRRERAPEVAPLLIRSPLVQVGGSGNLMSHDITFQVEFDCRPEAEVPRESCLLPSRMRTLRQGNHK